MTSRLSEKQFSQQVVDLARIHGWRVYRTWLSIKSPAGFPDLVLVRPPRLVFAELKSEVGATSPAQDDWLVDLRSAAVRQDRCGRADHRGFDVFVWRPSDFDEVSRVLAR